MASRDEPLIGYLLRTVRVGIIATWIAVAGLGSFLLLSSRDTLDRPLFIGVLAAALAGAAVVSVLPWERLLHSSLGMPALYAWSVLDIILITLLLEASGGGDSVVFVMYALTTVFFSASYPRSAQVGLLVFTLLCYLLGSTVGDWHVDAAGLILRFSILTSLAYIVSYLSRELIQQNALLADQISQHERTTARLSEAQRLARLGSWRWSPQERDLTISAELCEIYGIEQHQVEEDPAFLLELVHEDDRAEVTNAYERAASERSSFALEHRIVRPDGPIRDVQAQGRVEPDSDPPILIGTVLDITERKRAQEYDAKLRELASKRRQALQINDDLVQGITVAIYAIQMGRLDMAREALETTIKAARSIVGDLLDEAGSLDEGSLVRTEPAALGKHQDPPA
jgi:PAS domain S-box-containing protein